MPGLYLLTTRAPGTLITALIYNGDHQADADGRAAEFMQAFGVSLEQMNVTESPFAADGVTEVLPVAVSDEIAVLRHEIAAIKAFLTGTATAPNWWSPIAAPAFTAIGARVLRGSNQSIPDTTPTTLDFTGGTASFNNGNIWEGVTHPTRFTAPSAGLYYAAGAVRFQSGAGGNEREMLIGVNGTPTPQSGAAKVYSTQASQEQWLTCCALLKLAANDYVEFVLLQTSGGAINALTDTWSPMGSLLYFGATQ